MSIKFTTISPSMTVLALGTALFAGVAGVAAAAPAAAVPVDRPIIAAAGLDFGGSFAGGAPTTGGWLRWKVNAAGVVTPTLTGNLQLNNGQCGKIRVEYYSPNHTLLGARQTGVSCGPSTTVVRVDNFSNPAARHVHINMDRRNLNGTFTTVGTSVQSF